MSEQMKPADLMGLMSIVIQLAKDEPDTRISTLANAVATLCRYVRQLQLEMEELKHKKPEPQPQPAPETKKRR